MCRTVSPMCLPSFEFPVTKYSKELCREILGGLQAPDQGLRGLSRLPLISSMAFPSVFNEQTGDL